MTCAADRRMMHGMTHSLAPRSASGSPAAPAGPFTILTEAEAEAAIRADLVDEGYVLLAAAPAAEEMAADLAYGPRDLAYLIGGSSYSADGFGGVVYRPATAEAGAR